MTIALTRHGEKWLIASAYADKDIVKAAGARWDPAKRTWWTDKADVASVLGAADVTDIVASINAKREAKRIADEAAIEASKATDAALDIPAPDGLAYLPYQRGGIAYGMARESVLIGDEMGLGKTIQALGIVNADPTITSVLVICPASLKLNWKREAAKWLVRPMRAAVVNGGKFPPASLADFVIVNYDILGKHRKAIDARGFDMIVVDEAHYCKNPKAARTKNVLGGPAKKKNGKVVEDPIEAIKARRRVFLTGTPIANRPVELWPLVQSLDPNGLGKNWKAFVYRYCAAHFNGYAMDTKGASNLDEMQMKLRAACMVRRLKKDVLTELPPKRRQIIALEPASVAEKAAVAAEDAAQRANEERMEALRVAVELSKASDDPAEYAAAVEALRGAATAAFTEMSKLRHDVALAKLPQVVAHIEDAIEETPKVIVFAHHHDVIDGLMGSFPNAVKLDGTMDMASRQASVDRFQNDPSVGPFIASIMAAGVGITLTAASHVVFAELDWVPGNLSQAEDRAHRIGQTNSVLVQHIVLDGSLDATMAARIVAKQDVIDRALDRDGATPSAVMLEVPPEVPTKASAGATEGFTRAQVEAEAATLTPEVVEAVHAALRILAGLDWDGALLRNDVGFNGCDTKIGRSLAAHDRLTPKQVALGRKIVRKYHRQLPADMMATIKGE